MGCRRRRCVWRWALLAGVESTPEVDVLIADRGRAGLPTVVDLGAGDLERTATTEPRLAAPAVARAVACGHVVLPAGGLHGRPAVGVRTMVLPTLFTREYGVRRLPPAGWLTRPRRWSSGGNPKARRRNIATRSAVRHRERVD